MTVAHGFPSGVVDGGITASALVKRYERRGATVRALDGVDLNVAPGEFVSLLGPSGCGKSTLLRLVAGLIEPTAGELSVAGASPGVARRSKKIALVPQTPALLPWRTAYQNITLLTELNRRAGGAVPHDRAAELIAAVGLSGFERARPGELSGGMAQRVAVARAFLLDAPVLLMDEPFAALDEITRAEMRVLLGRIWSQARRTVLFVTHSIPEAVALSDRVVVLCARPGRVVADIAIALDHPRASEVEDTDRFVHYVREVRAALRLASDRPND